MASGFALALRIALAAIFAVAAVGKLSDRRGTVVAVRSFGAPAAVVAAVATLLPTVELAAAVLLLPGATAAAGAVLTLALLAVFSGAVAFNLARGRRPDCHCFGQVGSEPIGASTLLRNGALAAAAVAVLALGSGPSALSWIGATEAGALALGLGAGLAVAGWVGFSLMRRQGRSLERIDELETALADAGVDLPEPDRPGLPVGTEAPSFPGIAPALAAGKPLFVVFSSSGCGPCRELAPTLAGWREVHSSLLEFVELDIAENEGLMNAYEVQGTPAAVVVGPEGAVASYAAHGAPGISELLTETLHDLLPPPADVGELVPDVRLESTSGEQLALRDAIATDRDTLLLFWNPGCGFCSSMRDGLRRLDEAPLEGDPALLVASTGEPDDIRAEGFLSTVLLDPMSLASSALGAGGTPTAVRIAPNGEVISTVAGGSAAVLELAGIGAQPVLEVMAMNGRTG